MPFVDRTRSRFVPTNEWYVYEKCLPFLIVTGNSEILVKNGLYLIAQQKWV